MFYQAFPDLTWLKNQAESRFSNRTGWNGTPLPNKGWPTVILNVKAGETYRDNIPGPLSFFSTLHGKSSVEIEGQKVFIPSHCFYLTNAGQRYTLEIEEKEKAETFNIHFGNQWAEEVWVSLAEKDDLLLEQPDRANQIGYEFYNKIYRKDEFVERIQQQLINTKNDGLLKREELLYELIAHLIKENNSLACGAMALPISKASTRGEILRRLFLATDFIYSYPYRTHTLEELAQISCLSKFHFLRLFKKVFRQTPHQFIIDLRIKNGMKLLANKNVEVRSVAQQLGFDSSSSFSRLFFQHVGVYPSQFQQAY
jgi:AraC family transcriptional regulator